MYTIEVVDKNKRLLFTTACSEMLEDALSQLKEEPSRERRKVLAVSALSEYIAYSERYNLVGKPRRIRMYKEMPGGGFLLSSEWNYSTIKAMYDQPGVRKTIEDMLLLSGLLKALSDG